MREIDLDKTLFQLTEQYPELIEILGDFGFMGVKNPVIRKTLGKKTTLREGCRKQGKSVDDIRSMLEEMGFTVLE